VANTQAYYDVATITAVKSIKYWSLTNKMQPKMSFFVFGAYHRVEHLKCASLG